MVARALARPLTRGQSSRGEYQSSSGGRRRFGTVFRSEGLSPGRIEAVLMMEAGMNLKDGNVSCR